MLAARQPRFRPLANRGRKTIVAILVLFCAFSILSVVLTTRVTARSGNRAAVVQVASRQRTLAERYTNEVVRKRSGAAADPDYVARIMRESARALLDGGVAPSVNGDDDGIRLSGTTEPVARAQLEQSRRLVDDLVTAGRAILAGRPVEDVKLNAKERIDAETPEDHLRVIAALAENVSLNAARTIATDTDRNVSQLMQLQLWLGGAGLVVAFGLGWALVAATRRQTEHFRALVTASTDFVLVFTRGGCGYASHTVAALVGADDDALLGHGYAEFVHPDDRSLLETVQSTGEPHELVFRMSNRFGEWRHLEALVTDLRQDRRVRGVLLNSRDVTERVRLEGELTHQAFHDELTGLANRALFRDRLDHALARSARSNDAVVVLLLDLDWFKQVNDTLGHDAGDRLLQEIAHRLARTMRPSDTLARLGGDEFAILLEGSSEDEAAAVAARVLDQLRADPVDLGSRALELGASIGVAVHAGGSVDSEELVRRADVAMYVAKDAGRGRFEIFRPDMLRGHGELLGLEHDLRRALERGELSVHYQPSFAIVSGALVGVEALVRWHSPTRGQVPPDRFVPVAEAAGLIHELGAFVLAEATRQTAGWEAEGLLPAEFATWVNLSAVQLGDGRMAETVRRTLNATGLSPARLGLEVTETAIVVEGSAAERARVVLQQLHDHGVGIALDDFGTGFSSLGHLRRFPIDIIKIDRSFVQGIEHDPKDAAIAANLVSLAHALKLDVVAEGIETEGQLEKLRELGCDLAQGYLLGRPMPADALGELLLARRTPAVAGTS
jgi:diguanylate cyclase (GGDEF)-like protein/PAS domain S-box-containing protein